MDSARARISFGDNFSELATVQRRCLILVPRNECTTVNTLKDYIRSRFNITNEQKFGLSIDGYVLPEWESSEIIRENDTLCVFSEDKSSVLPVSSAKCSKNKKDSKRKKRKESEQGTESETGPVAKKVKQSIGKKIQTLDKEEDKSNNSKGDAENVVATNGGDDDDDSNKRVEEYNEVGTEESRRLQGEDERVNNGNSGGSITKNLLSKNNETMLGPQERINNNDKDDVTTKKKRRKRRKKKAKPNMSGNDPDVNLSKDAPEQREAGTITNGTIKHHDSTGKSCQEGNVGSSNQLRQESQLVFEKKKSDGHIIFDSNGDIESHQSNQIEIQEDLLESTKVTNLFVNSSENITEGNKTMLHQENDGMELQEDGETPTDDVEQGQQVQQVHKQITKNYEAYPPLNGPPRQGDVIAFKTLELSSVYTPEVSEFKEGVVTNYDHKTQQVDVQLTTVPGTTAIVGEDQRDGRFEMEPDEDWTTDRQREKETTLMSAYLPSLIDLKLIS